MSFDGMMWKIKSWFRKLTPLLVVGALLYGGHYLYKRHVFRGGITSTLTRLVRKVPYFGTRFRSYQPSYAVASRSYSRNRGRSHRRHHVRHGRRHGRRHR